MVYRCRAPAGFPDRRCRTVLTMSVLNWERASTRPSSNVTVTQISASKPLSLSMPLESQKLMTNVSAQAGESKNPECKPRGEQRSIAGVMVRGLTSPGL